MIDDAFHPGPPLIPGVVHADCVAVIVVPARNEAQSLPACLDALAAQSEEDGSAVCPTQFEILLLLNNCSDDSAAVAQAWQADHPDVVLHMIERHLPASHANVGTARRLLMNTAWCRLAGATQARSAILSTDSDTMTHPRWLVRNLRALQRGADAVGGMICLRDRDLERLPIAVQLAYGRDRRYRQLIAELEDSIDPSPGDPWPRHLDHFGASLACTRDIYARAGGIPEVAWLEDVAFIDSLHRIDARIRHDVSVQVSTSARLNSRAELGLGNQLRLWYEMQDGANDHRVQSAEWLTHRFTLLRELRGIFRGEALTSSGLRPHLKELIAERQRHCVLGAFLAAIDSDGIIARCFSGVHETNVSTAIHDLEFAVSKASSLALGFALAD